MCVFTLGFKWIQFDQMLPQRRVAGNPVDLYLRRFRSGVHFICVFISGLTVKMGLFRGTTKLECGVKMKHWAIVRLKEN